MATGSTTTAAAAPAAAAAAAAPSSPAAGTYSPNALRGIEKAAILIISLGPDRAAHIFRYLKEEEIENLAVAIAAQGKVTPELRESVIKEFYQISLAHRYLNQGGVDYARDLLERALGPTKAHEILDRLTDNLRTRPFEGVRKTDPAQLATFLQSEHPQTVAVVLAHLRPDQSAVVLSSLPPERQADVVRRIANMTRTSPDVLQEVEKVLERKLSSIMGQQASSTVGGVEWVVEVLNQVDRSAEKAIMEALAAQDPELADDIKQRMFVFEDIALLDNRSLQRVLREVDMSKDMPLALKVASDDLQKKIMSNISKRAAENLKESLDFLGPVRLRDVEEAQTRIVAVVRRLEDSGEISTTRGSGGDDILV